MNKLFGAAIACALFVAGPAWAGWERLTWNMTPEQAAAAMPGVAFPDRGGPDDELEGAVLGNKGPWRFAGLPLTAAMYYDEQGLAQVKIWHPDAVDCDPFRKALVATYGSPLYDRKDSFLGVAVWHDVEADTRISLVYAQGALCSLDYFRLSDYEAADRQKAGVSAHR